MVYVKRVSVIAAVAATFLLITAVFLHSLVRQSQADQTVSVVKTFSDEIAARLEERIATRFSVVELLKFQWSDGGIDTLADFRRAANSVLKQFPDIQALNWVNGEGVITQVNPIEGNEAALGLNVRALEKTAPPLMESVERNALSLTEPIELAQGGLGFAAYTPVFVNGKLQGHINIVFRTAPLVQSVIGEAASDHFIVAVYDDGKTLFRTPGLDDAPFPAVRHPIKIGSRTWEVAVAPSRQLIENSSSYLDDILLGAGLILAILVPAILGEAHRSRHTLRDREERFALAMEGTSDGLFDIDAETLEAYFSPRWFQMLGYETGELPGTYETFRSLLHPDDAHHVASPSDVIRTDNLQHEVEFRMRHKNGSWRDIKSRARLVYDGEKVTRLVGTHVDVTELRQEQRKLKKAAITDDLTDLRNRRGLTRVLQREIQKTAGAERFCIMRIDLDRFKSVNDRDGHEAGDAALREIAARLRNNTYDFSTIARMGGDEFLIAWQTEASDERIRQIAESLVNDIEEPIFFSGKELRIGASVGVSFAEKQDADEVSDAISAADIALMSSKSSTSGSVVFFEQSMRDVALQEAALASGIREGLERGEFEPFFQPQIDLRSNRIVGFEALARWRHPTQGILPANAFVSAAETAHLIEAIDEQILERACEVLPILDMNGLPNATVSINVSTARLMDHAIVDRMLFNTDAVGIAPSRICIELLESTLLSNRMEAAVQNIHELARAGFRIDLDDFGTGHAAISSLRNFPVSRIKIDRSFVTGVHADQDLQLITTTLIDLAKKLGVDVLAEGIETHADWRFLEHTWCDQLQGFGIARPMPLEDLEEWISDWHGQCRELSKRSA